MGRSTRAPLRRVTIGILMLVVLAGCERTADSVDLVLGSDGASKAPEIQDKEIQDEWGVEVLGVRRTAAGYMLDFRYRVHDAEKAAPILDRRITPYIKVEETGVRLLVPQAPKLGSMRQTSFAVKADRDYFIVFANPAQTVAEGDHVSVVIGDFESPTMVVQ